MIKELQICYQTNPIGLDELPRFSWKLTSSKQNVVQTAYQIQVICQGQLIWNSGVVESDRSTLIPYEGAALLPMTAYQVQVSVWDNYQEMGQGAASFETGLMKEENFEGQWITHQIPDTETGCPVYTKQISVEKKIKKARIYATALGVYEIRINGQKVSDHFFAPGWTSYHNRLQYQTYDVTELLGDGENGLEILVANGWYKGEFGFEARPNIYGDRTAVRAALFVEYQDGSRDVVGTDESWQVSVQALRYSEIYHGEEYDFSSEAVSYENAVAFEDLDRIGAIVAQEAEPVRITKRFSVVKKFVTPKGELVFDFGQNMAGFVEVKLPKLTGEKLVIRHAETLDKDGNFYTENLRTARCTDSYTYGEDMVGTTVHPHFTFHGFRYICVEGAAEDVSEDTFTACALHTDMKQTGSFAVDHPLLNQLQSNIEWGQRGNFLDIPTDCPQRNERLGWTGDAQVFCGTASYNFETASFFKKWMRDMAAETTPEWGVPHVVPNILGDQAGAAAWSDAATIIPWKTYQAYGDLEFLREEYPMMKMWVDYMTAHALENGLWQTGFQYGDWLALDIESGSTDRTGGTDKYLVANAYYAYSADLVRKAAHELGYEEDEKQYADLHESVRDAINEEFITRTGRLVCETQTACVLMLYFDLAKPEYRKRILDTLETNIGAHHGHLTTGFVGTPYLCHCLTEEGLHSVANEIVLKEDFPSWLYAVKKGATTIWERWNSILPDGSFDESGMNSLNHYAYGSIGSWFYEKVAGIRPLAPGYKKILIAPNFTKGIMEYKAAYESVYGTIRSEMKYEAGNVQFTIEVPANTTAVICLPEREQVEVGSGIYTYEYATEVSLEQEKYNLESTLGELVAEDLGRTMFEQLVPGMLDNPMIKFAYEMTISELLLQAADAKPLYMAVIDALNQQG